MSRTMHLWPFLLTVLLAGHAACAAPTRGDLWKAASDRAAVAAGGAEVADAAIEVLEDGGD